MPVLFSDPSPALAAFQRALIAQRMALDILDRGADPLDAAAVWQALHACHYSQRLIQFLGGYAATIAHARRSLEPAARASRRGAL
jgi:hypothetical protein